MFNSHFIFVSACLHGGGGPQVGEKTHLSGVKKIAPASFTSNLTTPPSRDALSQDY